MEAKSFKNSGHGWRTDIFQMLTDIFPLHSKRHVFATADYFQYFQIIGCEKVDAAVGAFLFYDWAGNFSQFSVSIAVVIKRWDELQVPVVGRFHDCEQLVKAVDAFFQRSFLLCGTSVSVFHFPFYPEGSDVIAGAFYP